METICSRSTSHEIVVSCVRRCHAFSKVNIPTLWHLFDTPCECVNCGRETNETNETRNQTIFEFRSCFWKKKLRKKLKKKEKKSFLEKWDFGKRKKKFFFHWNLKFSKWRVTVGLLYLGYCSYHYQFFVFNSRKRGYCTCADISLLKCRNWRRTSVEGLVLRSLRNSSRFVWSLNGIGLFYQW